MRVEDREQFALVVSALAATFNRDATEALLEGYWIGLNDLALPAVKRAAAVAMRECRFMPTVVELRDLAGELSPQGRAVLAWGILEKTVLLVGGYKSVDFDDPCLNATVRNLGGWERICEMPADEFDKWLRKDFERTYQTLLRTGVSREAAAPLTGIHDRTNGFHGHQAAMTEPLRIETGLPVLPQDFVRLPGPKAQHALPRGVRRIGDVLPRFAADAPESTP